MMELTRTQGPEAEMKKLLLASSALVFAGSAVAADLQPRMSVKAPVVAAVPYSWSGCYVGGHAGYGWGTTDFFDPFGNFAAPVTGGGTLRVRSQGALAGGQIGCNYQIASNWVIGVEGEYSWANIRGDTTGPDLFFGGKNLSSKTDALASVTGRVGYNWDRVLFYGKGGAAWARDRYNEHTPPFNFFIFNVAADDLSARADRLGWTVGVGAEWAFADKWSAKIEYNHYDFGNRSLNLTDITGGFTPTTVTQRIDTVKVGINYRFWSPSPVIVAKY
ncbi:MAG: outer rane immunogenic protein [Bradyrhizobium sp.]|jgi:outer membrane immunogenic protein|nr:outer rane immunogenic protein [Bradyrhizobium sp.]